MKKNLKGLNKRVQDVMKQKKERGIEHSGWLRAFFRELFTMPRRHIFVFLIATVLLILLEVELTEGWHLIHVMEIIGGMMFVYLLWAAWRAKK